MESTDIQNTENVTPDVVLPKKSVKKRKKAQELDEDGNPIKKKRNTRANRYPLVKRKYRNAYQIYIAEMAKRNKEEGGPSKTPIDYAASWRSETDEGKAPWFDRAKDELKEYIKEVQAHGYTYEDKWTKSNDEKKPSGPFLLYARDHHKRVREEMGVSYAESLTELGARWKGDIDPELKQRYVDQAKEEKRLYDERKVSKVN
jgi:hypothetical protein